MTDFPFHCVDFDRSSTVVRQRSTIHSPLTQALDGVVANGGGRVSDLWGVNLKLFSIHGPDGNILPKACVIDLVSTGPLGQGETLSRSVACWDIDSMDCTWARAQSLYLADPDHRLGTFLAPDGYPKGAWIASWQPSHAPASGFPWVLQEEVRLAVAWLLADRGSYSVRKAPDTESERIRLQELIVSTPFRDLVQLDTYRVPMAGTPDILMMSPNEEIEGISLETLGAPKLVFLETEGDHAYMRKALSLPIPLRKGLLDLNVSVLKPNFRSSSFRPSQYGTLIYVPPRETLPYIVMTMLPVNAPGLGFARDRYGYDVFVTEDDAFAQCDRIAQRMRAEGICMKDVKVMLYEPS